jgi:flagellar export protein FliJ
MAFRFSLKTVLKYREEIEKREERTLEVLRETLARLETQLAEVKEHQCRLIVERESLLKASAFGDDLHYATQHQQQWKRVEEDLRRQVSGALLDYEKQMKVFLASRQKREILDELKNTQQDSYNERLNRQEQQKVDEIYIARLNRDT